MNPVSISQIPARCAPGAAASTAIHNSGRFAREEKTARHWKSISKPLLARQKFALNARDAVEIAID
ncbi:MAG TPA: hypothetical protein VE998_02035 [Terriglobales bacterium]|nr:hypothetical protein [Terriglobales bacterium]